MQDDGAMHLVFLGQTRPVLLKLNIIIDGKPVAQRWNDYLQKWFELLDGDDNGKLDAAEASRAPTPQVFMQFASQSPLFAAGFDPRAKTQPVNFNTPAGQGVSLRDFQQHYTRVMVPIQFQAQSDNGAFFKEVNKVLFATFDQNKDGKLAKEEIASGAVALRKYDLEDTEWLTAQNLAPALADPFGIRAAPIRLDPSAKPPESKNEFFFHVRPGNAGLPQLLLARYDKSGTAKLDRDQSGLDTTTFRQLDVDGDRGLNADELSRWHERPADFEITLPIGTPGGPPVQIQVKPQSFLHKNALKPIPAGTMMELDDAHITLAGADAGAVFIRPAQTQLYMQFFKNADTKQQGFVTMKDLEANRQFLQILGQVFTFADRDRDDKLTEMELKAFVALQVGSVDAFATVSLADQGRVLFQHLDVNKDSRLSLRELQNAWTRLSSFDANGDGLIEQSEMALQFQISAQRGQPGTNFGQVVAFSGPRPAPMMRPGGDGKFVPPWFSKMDKNGDGDVSRREFLGSAADFARIDADGDGLISAEEAARLDPRPAELRRER